MPSTIRDLTELTTVAVDDYILISDTSDVTNRDKRISITNLQLPLPHISGTPVAGRVASWFSATTLQDAGFAASDVARLSQIQTQTGRTTFQAATGATLAYGAIVPLGQNSFSSRSTLVSNVTKRVYGQFVAYNVTNAVQLVGTIDIANGASQTLTLGASNTWLLDVSSSDNTLGIQRTASGSQIALTLIIGWI